MLPASAQAKLSVTKEIKVENEVKNEVKIIVCM
jgi:hypothetical protein